MNWSNFTNEILKTNPIMTTSLTAVIKKLLLFFLVFFGLILAKDFLIPFCIGAILAMLFLPMCQWLENKKLPKGLSVLVCFLTFLIFIFLMVSILGYKISELVNDVEILKQKTIILAENFQKYIFDNLNITAAEQIKILKNEQPSYANIVQMALGSLTGFLSSFVLLLVYFVFLLYYRNHIKNFLIMLTAKSEQSEMKDVIQKVAQVSQQYLIGLSKMIFLLWIMYGVGFSFIGVENAIFFAVLCGLLEIIPFVGNITGTTLTILVSAMHGASLEVIIGIVIIYGTVQLIQGWILEPLILGPQVKINSLFTIIALILGELIWGIPGIILAIPLTAMFKIVCDHILPMKPYGFLIGEIETSKKEISWLNKIKKLYTKQC